MADQLKRKAGDDCVVLLRSAARNTGADQILPQSRRPQGSRDRRSARRDRRRDRAERFRQEHLLQSRQRLPAGRSGRGSVFDGMPISTVRPPRSCGSASPGLSRARGSSRPFRCRECARGGAAAPPHQHARCAFRHAAPRPCRARRGSDDGRAARPGRSRRAAATTAPATCPTATSGGSSSSGRWRRGRDC